MPRIKIEDLPADENLDADSMERVRGGILISGYQVKIEGAPIRPWDMSNAYKIQGLNYEKF